jgi:hypothetical protein
VEVLAVVLAAIERGPDAFLAFAGLMVALYIVLLLTVDR